jgi:SWI/SNF-related matrix-associated actin-dependent regulator 1 of chromatin subfamily A
VAQLEQQLQEARQVLISERESGALALAAAQEQAAADAARLREAEEALAARHVRFDALDAQQAALQRELSDALGALAQEQAARADISAQLETANNRLAQEEAELAALREQLRAAQSAREGGDAAAATAAAAVAAAENRLAEVEARLAAATAAADAAAAVAAESAAQQSAEIVRLQEELHAAQQKLKDSSSALQEYQETARRLHDNCQHVLRLLPPQPDSPGDATTATQDDSGARGEDAGAVDDGVGVGVGAGVGIVDDQQPVLTAIALMNAVEALVSQLRTRIETLPTIRPSDDGVASVASVPPSPCPSPQPAPTVVDSVTEPATTGSSSSKSSKKKAKNKKKRSSSGTREPPAAPAPAAAAAAAVAVAVAGSTADITAQEITALQADKSALETQVCSFKSVFVL